MSETTKSVKSVVVISDAQESDILDCFRTLHHKVLGALQTCDIKPLFPTEFSKCGSEDYKLLHQQSRTLIATKRNAKWEARISGIRTNVQGVVNAYMVKARAAKAQFDALKLSMGENGALLPAFPSTVTIPMSDIVGCFPSNTDMKEVWKDLNDMSFQVGKGKDDTAFVKVPFTAEKAPTVTADVSEAAPESGEAVKAA